MNTWTRRNKVPLGIAFVGAITAWMAFTRPDAIIDTNFLGGLLFLEGMVAIIWNYRQRFFPALIVVFLLAGINVPMQGVWGAARWFVLGIGAFVGVAVYPKKGSISSYRFQLAALSCAVAAAISAEMSSLPKQSLLKAVSLFLFFLYGSFGARLAILHKEERFAKGLLWGCEMLIYFAAFQYLIFRQEFFGNPNSLGAVMAVAGAPVMLWGTFTSADSLSRRRRVFALFLCVTLILTSYSRSAIVAGGASCFLLCLLLRQYRFLIKGLVVTLGMAAIVTFVVPLPNAVGPSTLSSRFVFKGKEQAGVLASRRPVWDATIASIKQHPWLGIGFGTAPIEKGAEDQSGRFSSTSATTREHGDSYLALVEGAGIVGALPFSVLLFLAILNISRVLKSLRRSRDPSWVAVPIAFILIAGFIHAMFEDWLFAVGYYLCIFFWSLAFMLLDLIPPDVARLERNTFQVADVRNRDLLAALGR